MRPTIKIFKLDGSPMWDRTDSRDALDFIPPIGSTIFYKTFRANEHMKDHEITDYVLNVERIESFTEEGFNGLYINKEIGVVVSILDEFKRIQNPTES